MPKFSPLLGPRAPAPIFLFFLATTSSDEPRIAFNFRSPSASASALLRKDPTAFNILPSPTAHFFRGQSGRVLLCEADGIFELMNDEHSCTRTVFIGEYYKSSSSLQQGEVLRQPLVVVRKVRVARHYITGVASPLAGASSAKMYIRFRLAALGRANPELVDVVLSQVDGLACHEVLGCNATALGEEYGITGALAPREEVYGVKYAMDVTGGFFGLLCSGSLAFKACFFVH
ncbi:hypothetical protein K438DRAFT_1757760 [Mycena galopus ATCC 62051]|nr:hypothetical protein K438DRAFT_1757760 [Mycena galopus ATCC 62051]